MSALKKLNQARITLQSKKLNKSGHNKFAGYQYFELGDFLPTIQSIFDELELSGVVSYGVELATLTITDIEDGSSIQVTSPMSTAALKGCHEVQNLGAVQTYIRRYLWVTALEIVEHDALDATTGKKSTVDKAEEERIQKINEALKAIRTDNLISRQYEAWVAMKPLFKDEVEEANAWGKLDSTTRRQIKEHGTALREATTEEASLAELIAS